MEIKAQLQKPYTEQERINFIIENNYKKGYEIKETDVALEAWGQNGEELLKQAKERKYKEACSKAYGYLNGGEGLLEISLPLLEDSEGEDFEGGESQNDEEQFITCHIEATDGNIAKLGLSYAQLVINQDFISTIDWCTHEDEIIQLNAQQLNIVVNGLKDIQSEIWTNQYSKYLQMIKEASTVEEVEQIEIDYGKSL